MKNCRLCNTKLQATNLYSICLNCCHTLTEVVDLLTHTQVRSGYVCQDCETKVYSEQDGHYWYPDDGTDGPEVWCDNCFNKRFLCSSCQVKQHKTYDKITYGPSGIPTSCDHSYY